ncbi:MAG: pitrilysin family protein [Planctomycetota bacterium]
MTADAVQAVAERYLQSDNRTAGLFLPTKEPQKITMPTRPNLASMLDGYEGREVAAVGEAFDPAPEAIEKRVIRTELPSGLKVALLPKQTRGETVNARLSLRYGNEDALRGLSPASNLLGPLMMRGTAELSKQQLQDRLDELQASIRPGGADGVLTFSISAKRETLPAVMELLNDVLTSASLPAGELELLKQATLARIDAGKSEPQTLATTAVRRALSPYDDPADPRYVPTPEEQSQMLYSVTAEQVASIYRTMLSDGQGELAIVGSVDPDAALASAAATLTGFGSPNPPSFTRLPREANPEAPAGDVAIVTPDKKNAVYYAALQLPLSQEHPDYPALLIGNYVLGSSGLSSRLGNRVRQQEGLSYGVGSQLTPRAKDDLTTFGVYAITNPDNVPKLKSVIREELDRWIADGVTAAEVDDAKNSYLQKQRVSRSNDAGLASALGGQLYNDRTMAFTAKLEKAVADLTADEVNAALRKHIDPAKLFVAVAGDFTDADVPAASGE